MNQSRPPVPTDVARQLRQEARFGCSKCGNPIIEYHHIIRWEIEQHFRPEDMVAFCPNCHDEADAMTEQEERDYKANPINIQKGLTEGYLRLKQNNLVVQMGNNYFINNGTILSVDKERLMGIRLNPNGRLEISVDLYDKDDNLIAIIDNNDWILGNYKIWDFEFDYNYIIIRNKLYDISLELDAQVTPVKINGKLWRKKHLFYIKPSSIKADGFNNSVYFSNCTFGLLNANSITQSIELWPTG